MFDGRAFAREIEERVRLDVERMRVKPKVASILVGGDPASVTYSRLKQAAAERVGIQFEIVKLEKSSNQASIIKQKIEELGERKDVDGLMVQLPVPGLQGVTLKEVLSMIPLSKDVDGLRWEESNITPATVRAILLILEKMVLDYKLRIGDAKIVVVGARGSVGRPLVNRLKKRSEEVVELDLGDNLGRVKEGKVVVSCTGQPGLITGEMVTAGVMAIDVGSPSGDMTLGVYEKASVYVPSPGGVGPVTIASLLANACDIIR